MKIIGLTGVLLAILGLSLGVYNYKQKPKIGYVYNSVLLQEYSGLKEAFEAYEANVRFMQNELDSLSKDFNSKSKAYGAEKNKLSQKERMLTEELLRKSQAEILKYKSDLERVAIETKQNITTSNLNQIDQYLTEYGKEYSYQYIFGVTDNGSLLYAEEVTDITDEVVEYINEKYEGE